jgi:hypothetical protein
MHGAAGNKQGQQGEREQIAHLAPFRHAASLTRGRVYADEQASTA